MSRRLLIAALGAICLVLIPAAQAAHDTERATRDAYSTARAYVIRFYPRWFTWRQAQLVGRTVNHLVGPARMSPAWGIVVAPNDDTIYTSAQLDLSEGPAAFVDGRRIPLDASVEPAYVLTFSKAQIPQAKRFWSLTAYLPGSVTLVPNAANKYLVARYTPGLVTNSDGSISIYMQPTRPLTVPEANWLPVPEGPFNLLLRVYGPEGNTSPGTYEPPAIAPTFRR